MSVTVAVVHSSRRRMSSLVAIATLLAAVAPNAPAFAWKPTTHVHLAEIAADDARDDGMVTLWKTDYATGKVLVDGHGEPVPIGSFEVNPEVLEALRQYPAHFRAGVFGPDAYPDFFTGQNIIHPGHEHTNGPGPDAWFTHLWSVIHTSPNPADRHLANVAFVTGFLSHGAGDIYAHTFVNYYTGGEFDLVDPRNGLRHVMLEGYIGKRTPAVNWDARIDQGVNDFIYRQMIAARPTNALWPLYTGNQQYKSVPALFTNLRVAPEIYLTTYRASVAVYDAKVATLRAQAATAVAAGDACRWYDLTCSSVLLYAEAAALEIAALAAELARSAFTSRYGFGGVLETQAVSWINNIDAGLREWPNVSHDVAIALFYNPGGLDLPAAKERVGVWWDQYGSGMLGPVGTLIDIVNAVLNLIPDPFKPIVTQLKQVGRDLLLWMIEQAFGLTPAELVKCVVQPLVEFENVMNDSSFVAPGGHPLSRAECNRLMGLRDPGLTDSTETFDYRKFPPAYNTVVMTKLLMMKASEVERLMSLLNPHAPPSQARLVNAMVGFAGTLDGSNAFVGGDVGQWNRMVVARDPCAYRKIFMQQLGERVLPSHCDPGEDQEAADADSMAVVYYMEPPFIPHDVEEIVVTAGAPALVRVETAANRAPCGGSLSLDASGLPAGGDYEFVANRDGKSGTFLWNTRPQDAGVYRLRIISCSAAVGEGVANLRVVRVDGGPQLAAPQWVQAEEGSPLTFQVTASDPQGDPLLSLTANLSAFPAGANPNFTTGPGNTSGTLSWTPGFGDAGAYPVPFAVHNGLPDSSVTWVYVDDHDRPPVLSVPDSATALEGGVVFLAVTVSDPDTTPIDSLWVDASALPSGHDLAFASDSLHTAGWCLWHPAFTHAGTHTLRFHVRSGAFDVADSTRVHVLDNPDHPPVLAGPDSVLVGHGDTLRVTITVSDADGDSIGLLAVDLSRLPAGHGAVFTTSPDQRTGVLTWVPTEMECGTYPVVFRAWNDLMAVRPVLLRVGFAPPEPPPAFSVSWGGSGGQPGQFDGAEAIAVGPDTTVYVADFLNHRIQRFSSTGVWLGAWGGLGNGPGQLNGPSGIAINDSGDVFVCEFYNNRVQRFTASGAHVAMWGAPGALPGQLSRPDDVVRDAAGNLYVADSENHRVQKFTAGGAYLLGWGQIGTLPGQFQLPGGLAIDAEGDVYVTDTGNHRVQRFGPDGTYRCSWGGLGTALGQFQSAQGITSDGSRIIVADLFNHRVQAFTSGSALLLGFGGPGVLNGQFNLPADVAVGPDGAWYVAEFAGDRVQRFVPTGSLQPHSMHRAAAPPPRFALLPNYPNPFSRRTLVEFSLSRTGAARIDAIDVTGRRVAELFQGALPAGRHALPWDGRSRDGHRLRPGVYWVRLEAEGRSAHRKIVLMD